MLVSSMTRNQTHDECEFDVNAMRNGAESARSNSKQATNEHEFRLEGPKIPSRAETPKKSILSRPLDKGMLYLAYQSRLDCCSARSSWRQITSDQPTPQQSNICMDVGSNIQVAFQRTISGIFGLVFTLGGGGG